MPKIPTLIFLAVLAQQPDWPIRPIFVPLEGLEKGHALGPVSEWPGCQPEAFDPKTATLVPDETHKPGEQFRIPASDEACAVRIDGWGASGDHKLLMHQPYTAMWYSFFDGASQQSSVIEIKKNGARHALYTHIDEFRFSEDSHTLLLVNAISVNGEWRQVTRIIDVDSKKAVSLPNAPCVRHLADVGKDRIITYDEEFHACIWDMSGKLVAAYGFPRMPQGGEGRIPEALGFLPTQPSTMFVIYRPDERTCVVALQSIGRNEHAALHISNPPVERRRELDYDSCSPGDGLMVDWADLTLIGSQVRGHMRYRISPSRLGHLKNDWGPSINLQIG